MTDFITGPNGNIAYEWVDGDSPLPPIIFIHGFKSEMGGSKAEFLKQYCLETSRDFLRFDVFAHGQSDGDFMDFTIGKAVDDAAFILREALCRPAIIIGSSMGGWVGLRLLQISPEKFHGLIGIAAAPDFTREIAESLNEDQKSQLKNKGYFEEESDYDEPYIFTKLLLDEGEDHYMLDQTIETSAAIHLLQGKQDSSVPWEKAERIKKIMGGNAAITYIDDGDHSLSREADLEILKSAIEQMSA